MKIQKLLATMLMTVSINLFCPPKQFAALRLNISDPELSEKDFAAYESENMGMRRQMSREYNSLMRQFSKLQMKIVTDEDAFKTLCRKVQSFTQKHLKNLAKNRLLYDEGHDPKQNDFNIVLLAGLRKFAKERHYSEELIPFTVVDDRGCLSGDESKAISSPDSVVIDPKLEDHKD